MRGEIEPHRVLGILAAGLAIAAAPALAQDPDALAACQLIDDATERLACYDDVLKPREAPAPEPAAAKPEPEPEIIPEPEPEPQPEPEPVQAAAPEPAPEPAAESAPATAVTTTTLSDDIGKETVKDDSEKEELAVRGQVVRCAKSSSRKYVVWFDNGQVWRQKGSMSPRWKDCTFEVVISKDVFGYTMSRVGEDRVYRFERVQ